MSYTGKFIFYYPDHLGSTCEHIHYYINGKEVHEEDLIAYYSQQNDNNQFQEKLVKELK